MEVTDGRIVFDQANRLRLLLGYCRSAIVDETCYDCGLSDGGCDNHLAIQTILQSMLDDLLGVARIPVPHDWRHDNRPPPYYGWICANCGIDKWRRSTKPDCFGDPLAQATHIKSGRKEGYGVWSMANLHGMLVTQRYYAGAKP